MRQKFVILGWQRTGSNMLVSALNAHPEVLCHGELLRKQVKGLTGALAVVRKIDERFHTTEGRHDNPMQYLDALLKLDNNIPFWGFKLLCNQNIRAWRRLAANPEWKCIVLTRENKLAAYSSGLIANETGQGIARTGDTIIRKEVVFDPDDFARYLARRTTEIQELKERLEENNAEYMETHYLDIVTPKGIDAVLEFLGAEASSEARPSTKKRNSSTILKRFTNPAQVESYLKQIGKLDWAEENPSSG